MSFRKCNEILIADDSKLFSRPFAALTQAAKDRQGEEGKTEECGEAFLGLVCPRSGGSFCLARGLASQSMQRRGRNKTQNVEDLL